MEKQDFCFFSIYSKDNSPCSITLNTGIDLDVNRQLQRNERVSDSISHWDTTFLYSYQSKKIIQKRLLYGVFLVKHPSLQIIIHKKIFPSKLKLLMYYLYTFLHFTPLRHSSPIPLPLFFLLPFLSSHFWFTTHFYSNTDPPTSVISVSRFLWIVSPRFFLGLSCHSYYIVTTFLLSILRTFTPLILIGTSPYLYSS